MTSRTPRIRILLMCAALFGGPVLLATSAGAQSAPFSRGEWRRVQTEHFEFLYPAELSAWALDMARRMEAVHGAVEALVGFAPEDRVTVLVDDPGNVSNGSMMPGPLLYVWPTPPNPRSMIGENRGWGEILAVHEFAHAAHLTRPSRNPRQRLLASLLPLPVTDLMRVTPRWAAEGYATYVEGRLTGSGRPHGTWRPAVLRTWALEGQLPRYGALNRSSGFYGGSMAYLVGSAFLEWLVTREGGDEEVLPDVWRRLTARERRDFDRAFGGVFGASPDELYGLFTVDVTDRALEVRDAVDAGGGVVDGELFQRYSWHTGDPAVSPDGDRLALRLTGEDEPSRLVVVSTTPDTLTAEERRRRAGIFERDPEDVPPVEGRPRAQEPDATLHPAVGRAYRAPAWMPDGDGILVVRDDVVENGRVRPDLFLWRWRDGRVRRITRGAAVREASPAPDGSWAVGTRCLHGRCDLVRIGIDDGAVRTIAEADPTRPYAHPRVSPDGGTIVASVQAAEGWRLVAMDADGSGERRLGPDDGAARFDAEFLADGRLILTSTRGGIHDLERLDPVTGEVTPLTRVLGAAVAPSPGPGGDVFFLSLHSRGWDLRRLPGGAAAVPEVVADPALAPAASAPGRTGDAFPEAPIGPVRPYGAGPRFRTVLPMIHLGVDGSGGGASVVGTDPIGRLSWQVRAMYGGDEAPVGGSLQLRYRGLRPWLQLEGFWARDPFGLAAGGDGGPAVPEGAAPLDPGAPGPDDAFYGGFAALELRSERLAAIHGLRAGASAARFGGLDASRLTGFGAYDVRLRQTRGDLRFHQRLGVHGEVGRSAGLDWVRWRVEGGLAVRSRRRGLEVTGTMAGTDAPGGSIEAFGVGGALPLFDPAVLSQRVAMPALRTGALRGDAIRTVRADLHGRLPLTAFFWAGDVERDGREWLRVVGLEADESTSEIPFLRLPAIRLRLGLARLLDGPGEGEWRGWLILGYR